MKIPKKSLIDTNGQDGTDQEWDRHCNNLAEAFVFLGISDCISILHECAKEEGEAVLNKSKKHNTEEEFKRAFCDYVYWNRIANSLEKLRQELEK